MKNREEQAEASPGAILEHVPGYLSIRETAQILGVSERSVYWYVERGKLPGARIGNLVVVDAQAVEHFERRAPGRVRTTTPPWHMPPQKNLQYLTSIAVRMCPGQNELLEIKLHEIRVEHRHRFPGTCARYIARNQNDPDEIEILLVWRSVAMPSLEVRETALAALYADLADVLDWSTAVVKESRVLLHA